ncbi:MAG: hypothetical protein NTW96_25765 [Planctomycetia bacterium]|nr:hypothetical protein [Planctomycetia bacterium]
MAPSNTGRQAVYIGTLPETFKPQRVWDVPPSLTSVELYAKNLSMEQAAGFARTFNKAQMELPPPGRRWALVVKHLKTRGHGEHPDAIRARKGGAL